MWFCVLFGGLCLFVCFGCYVFALVNHLLWQSSPSHAGQREPDSVSALKSLFLLSRWRGLELKETHTGCSYPRAAPHRLRPCWSKHNLDLLCTLASQRWLLVKGDERNKDTEYSHRLGGLVWKQEKGWKLGKIMFKGWCFMLKKKGEGEGRTQDFIILDQQPFRPLDGKPSGPGAALA